MKDPAAAAAAAAGSHRFCVPVSKCLRLGKKKGLSFKVNVSLVRYRAY
jgi:hypothetical protein